MAQGNLVPPAPTKRAPGELRYQNFFNLVFIFSLGGCWLAKRNLFLFQLLRSSTTLNFLHTSLIETKQNSLIFMTDLFMLAKLGLV